MEEDPLADDQNLYSYGFNSPLNYVDPSGNWNVSINWGSVLTTAISKISPELGQALSAFRMLTSGIDQLRWEKFLKAYSEMDEDAFKNYLESEDINYEFNENNTQEYVFNNSDGQEEVNKTDFASAVQKTLTGEQKMAAYDAMKGNIRTFLENNPGLSLEQVKGIFDSAVISADNEWGFGKNEFRFEGRGSNYNDLYGAEAVVMDKGRVMGVFTRANTLPDNRQSATVDEGVYDYRVGRHHIARHRTEINQPVPLREDGSYYQYTDDNGNVRNITNWTQGAYKALRLQGALPAMRGGVRGRRATAVNSHAGFENQRASAGCMTIHISDYEEYMDLFDNNDRGKFVIIR